MSIYKVNSRLNYSGEIHEPGTFIEGEEEKYGYLAEAGVLQLVDAETVSEAAAIIERENAEKAAAAEAAEASKPKDTWGPQEPEKEPETPVETAPKTETQPESTGAPVEVGQGDQPPAPNAGDNL